MRLTTWKTFKEVHSFAGHMLREPSLAASTDSVRFLNLAPAANSSQNVEEKRLAPLLPSP